MIEIILAPTPSFKDKIKDMPKDKQDLLSQLLAKLILQIFAPYATACKHKITTEIEVNFGFLIEGIFVPHEKDGDKYVSYYAQKVSEILEDTRLRTLFFIQSIRSIFLPEDRMLIPADISLNIPGLMQQIFVIDEARIPERFLCPIERTVMGDPAYLRSNPKISYEYKALFQWISEKGTDPTTRAPISAPGIVRNSDLKKEIVSFFVDCALGLDAAGAPAASTSHSSFFTSTSSTPPSSASSPMFSAFTTCKLGSELIALTGKAIRRAAMAGCSAEIKTILQSFPPEEVTKIVNLQDEHPDSKKTALHHAILNRHSEVIVLLRRYGAKDDIPDAHGTTAHALLENQSPSANSKAV